VIGRCDSFATLIAAAGTCTFTPGTSCDIIGGEYNGVTLTGNFTGTIASVEDTANCLTDATLAYDAAYGLRFTFLQVSDIIGGRTLTPGCYHQNAAIDAAANTNITLDAGGDPNAVFVIAATGALGLGADSYIVLLNGATYDNIFWVIEGAVTVGAGGILQGITLTIGAITLGADSKLCGRGLAHVAALSMNEGSIIVGNCDLWPQRTAILDTLLCPHVITIHTADSSMFHSLPLPLERTKLIIKPIHVCDWGSTSLIQVPSSYFCLYITHLPFDV
jgi:hypothetical protein